MNQTRPVALTPVNSPDYVLQLLSCLDSGRLVVVASAAAQAAHWFDLEITETITPKAGSGWLTKSWVGNPTDQPALVAATSGTEGVPKGILLSHRNLFDAVRRLTEVMSVDSTIREYVGIPVYHSFGFGRCRAVAAVGGRSFLPEKGFNPVQIAEMLGNGEINAISAVPTLWRILLSRAELFADVGAAVRWIEIGSQYMSRQEKEALKRIFPCAKIVQHYGLTEASRTTFLDISQVTGPELESVGKPMAGTSVELSDEGRIRIKGAHVALGRLTSGQVVPVTDAEGWLVTSDRGRISDGFLYFEGRLDDVINTGGLKLSPEVLEASLSQVMPDLKDFAICGVRDDLRGEGIVVAREASSRATDDQVRQHLDQILKAQGISLGNSLGIRTVAQIPRTANGKVQRKQLRQELEASIGDTVPPPPSSTLAPASVRTAFQKHFPKETIDPNVSFASLGGDSLGYVQMVVSLEKHLHTLPDDWERKPLAELELLASEQQLSGTSRKLEVLDTSTALRAVAILQVTLIHSGYYRAAGATIMLMALIGYNFARFQSPRLLGGQVWPTIVSYLAKILIPSYVVILVYTLMTRDVELGTILLIGNFFSKSSNFLLPVWFILNLVQVLVMVGLFMVYTRTRAWLSQKLWERSCILLGGSIAFQGAFFWGIQGGKYTLYYPWMYLPVFLAGWCLYLAKSRRQNLITLAVSIPLIPLNVNVGIQHLWLALALLLLAFAPPIPTPKWLKVALTTVASATFYIFVFNMGIIWAFRRLAVEVGIPDYRPIRFVVALATCLAISAFFEKFVLNRSKDLSAEQTT